MLDGGAEQDAPIGAVDARDVDFKNVGVERCLGTKKKERKCVLALKQFVFTGKPFDQTHRRNVQAQQLGAAHKCVKAFE